MAEEEVPEETPAKPSLKKPLMIGVVLALIAGGGGFYAMYSGMLGGSSGGHDMAHGAEYIPIATADVAFVPLDPMIISLSAGGANRHLRFAAQLEVTPDSKSSVARLMPRFLDVLNGYLRAVDAADLENPTALIRLRAQMLRRVQVVAGHGHVRDLLITEFVLN